MAVGKKSKHEVSYSKGMPARHCGICQYFRGKTEHLASCTKVEGYISASMWCTLFKKKETK